MNWPHVRITTTDYLYLSHGRWKQRGTLPRWYTISIVVFLDVLMTDQTNQESPYTEHSLRLRIKHSQTYTNTHTHVWLDILNLMSNLTTYIVHVSCPRHSDYNLPCIIILYVSVTPQCGKLSTQTPHMWNLSTWTHHMCYVVIPQPPLDMLHTSFPDRSPPPVKLNIRWMERLTRMTHTWLQVRCVIKQRTYIHTHIPFLAHFIDDIGT